MRPAKYRDEKRRYPWWAKTVERPTTEFDLEKTERIAPRGFVGQPGTLQSANTGWEPWSEKLTTRKMQRCAGAEAHARDRGFVSGRPDPGND